MKKLWGRGLGNNLFYQARQIGNSKIREGLMSWELLKDFSRENVACRSAYQEKHCAGGVEASFSELGLNKWGAEDNI